VKRFLAVLAATVCILASSEAVSADPSAGDKGTGDSAKAQQKSTVKKKEPGAKAKAKQKSAAKKGPGKKGKGQQKADAAKLPPSPPTPPAVPVKGGGAVSATPGSGKAPIKFNPKGEQKP